MRYAKKQAIMCCFIWASEVQVSGLVFFYVTRFMPNCCRASEDNSALFRTKTRKFFKHFMKWIWVESIAYQTDYGFKLSMCFKGKLRSYVIAIPLPFLRCSLYLWPSLKSAHFLGSANLLRRYSVYKQHSNTVQSCIIGLALFPCCATR